MSVQDTQPSTPATAEDTHGVILTDLAAAVNDVAADKERAAEFGRAGRERAIRDFSWATIAAQTVDIYRSLI